MANANVTEINGDAWQQEVIDHGAPVLVDFWAPWCGPCRALAPTVDRIADEYTGRVKVAKVNVDDNQELAAKYGITSIPQLLVFNGQEQPVETIVGLVGDDQIKSALEKHLS